jgi:hypothetical protein
VVSRSRPDSDINSASRNLITLKRAARHSASSAKLSTNQRSDWLTRENAPTTTINPPKEHLPLKYAGDAMTTGATIEIHPYPAVIQVSLAVA